MLYGANRVLSLLVPEAQEHLLSLGEVCVVGGITRVGAREENSQVVKQEAGG